ncbi:hypothetical protein TNCT_58261 [Trichonephila clavata]|uniref:Uncharacterized protein n=1 Tax=Trichonephila clavata TaxID=2740835 RepID=A0A8X6GHH6_TRICU|nr:hypothetical protein TNCT_58261 [Trichonephila clavata]
MDTISPLKNRETPLGERNKKKGKGHPRWVEEKLNGRWPGIIRHVDPLCEQSLGQSSSLSLRRKKICCLPFSGDQLQDVRTSRVVGRDRPRGGPPLIKAKFLTCNLESRF